MSSLRRALALALPAALITAAPALASGPVAGAPAPEGVVGGGVRYLAVPAGRGTLLERISTAGGRPLRTRYVRGTLTVPAIAIDGTAGGLSADGRTLVLTTPHTGYPQARSTLAIVDAHRLLPRRVLHLAGDFSYDAISPDGSTLFLIELDRRDQSRYAVRALDVSSGRLFPGAIVDAREPDEVMRGIPVTRVSSPDGRFAYTLYSGGEHPFVHALDTVRMRAACLDLPGIGDASAMRLRLDGGRLAVLDRGEPVAYVDPATRRVSAPGAPAAPAATVAPATRPQSDGAATPWALLAGTGAVALALAAALLTRRRRAALRP